MKGVSDLFISKDKLAIFWFLVSCAILVVTAWHVNTIAQDGKSRMLYVIMNRQDVMYIDETLQAETPADLFDAQARLALETLLNRGPNGPLNMKRLPKLFSKEALDFASEDINSNGREFLSKQFHQMVEVGPVRVFLGEDGGAITVISGQVIRIGVDPVEQKVINQVLNMNARLVWETNLNMRDSKLFPFTCTDAAYTLTVISES